MELPTIPTVPASIDPEPWEVYWQEVAKYEAWQETQRRKEYRRKYYAKKTQLRQIAKMKELMGKYPDEAKAFLLDSE